MRCYFEDCTDTLHPHWYSLGLWFARKGCLFSDKNVRACTKIRFPCLSRSNCLLHTHARLASHQQQFCKNMLTSDPAVPYHSFMVWSDNLGFNQCFMISSTKWQWETLLESQRVSAHCPRATAWHSLDVMRGFTEIAMGQKWAVWLIPIGC